MPQNNHDEQIGQLDQRMTRVETVLESISTQLVGLTQGVKGIQAQQAESARPNYGVLISLGSFVVFVGAGLWAIAIRPIEQQQVALLSKTSDTGRRMELMEQDQVRIGERNEVLRVRLEASEALTTQRDQYNWILMQLMWKGVFKEELPSKDVWPTITRPSEMSVGGHSGESLPVPTR